MKKIVFVSSMLVSFTAGAIVSALIAKKVYNKKLNKEISDIREMYSKNPSKAIDKIKNRREQPKKEETKPVITEEEKRENRNYSKLYSNKSKEEMDEVEDSTCYLINEAEVYSCDYDISVLNYYRDRVISDDDGNIVNSLPLAVDNIIQNTPADIYDDGEIYIKDDINKTIYEVVLSDVSYADDWGNSEGIATHPTED